MRLIVYILLVVSIAACGGGDKQTGDSGLTPQEEIANLEASGAIPNLERGDSIAGTDSNNDGIRDDIEAYINTNYTDPTQNAAAKQTARAYQEALLVDPTNINDVMDASEKVSKGIHCLYEVSNGSNTLIHPAQISSELEAITANTKKRAIAYIKYNQALDGQIFSLPTGDTCE